MNYKHTQIASFGSLQVIIDEKYLQIKFGYGIYKKKFLLSDVISAKIVKNHWYFGIMDGE